MNVASKDLCQELYELSGWSDPDVELRSDIQYGYTLGYLLRKLPMYVKGGRLEMIYELDEDGQPWCFGYHYGSQRVMLSNDPLSFAQGWAEEPENAACKLAIKLLQHGILKGGQ